MNGWMGGLLRGYGSDFRGYTTTDDALQIAIQTAIAFISRAGKVAPGRVGAGNSLSLAIRCALGGCVLFHWSRSLFEFAESCSRNRRSPVGSYPALPAIVAPDASARNS